MDLWVLREAVREHLADRVADTNVYSFSPVGGVNPPYIAIDDNPDLLTFHETMRAGARMIRLVLRLRVNAGTHEAARKAIDAYLSYGAGHAQSILEAVRAPGPIRQYATPHLRVAGGAVFDDTGGNVDLLLDLEPNVETP